LALTVLVSFIICEMFVLLAWLSRLWYKLL